MDWRTIDWSKISPGAYTLLGSLTGGCFAIAGVYLTQSMVRKQQRQQWLLQRKQEECRELLTALSGAYVEVLRQKEMQPLSGEDEQEIEQAKMYSLRIIRDRMYIAPNLDLNEVSVSWETAMDKYESTFDTTEFKHEYDRICDRVRAVLIA
jgi:hypothetical protein